MPAVPRDDARAPAASGVLFLLLLGAIMSLRPAREAFGVGLGEETVRKLFIGTMVATLCVAPLFSVAVRTLARRRFVPLGIRICAAVLLAFGAGLVLAPEGEDGTRIRSILAGAYYVWHSVFNLFLVSLFWAFMADGFDLQRSRSWFGAIAVGGTCGALGGPLLTALVVGGEETGWGLGLPTIALFPAAAVILEAAAWTTKLVERQFERLPGARDSGPVGGGVLDAFSELARSRYLIGIALLTAAIAALATLLYFAKLRIVAAAETELDGRTTIFAHIDIIVQASTLFVQAFVTGFVMRRFGVVWALLALPIVAAAGFLALAFPIGLAGLTAVEASFKAAQRGLYRPARETLFTVVSRGERYKAKTLVDTFVYRTSDAATAWLEPVVARLGAGTALVAVPTAAVMATVGVLLAREQVRRAAKAEGGSGDDATADEAAGESADSAENERD